MTKFLEGIILVLSVIALFNAAVKCYNAEPILDEIHGYHFHTYFFQTNPDSTDEAIAFREQIQLRIDEGVLAGCRLNTLNMVPRGPHPIGSYETCCNKTAMSPAISWFMQNRGNLSILLHPLTRWEVEDHTTRAMFLGQSFKLDISALKVDLGNDVDMCEPLPESSTFRMSEDAEHHHETHNIIN